MIGIDTHCLSYIIDAFFSVDAPIDSLAAERIALARLFFYLPGTLWVTPTVTSECARIRNVERAKLHESFIAVLFGEPPLHDRAWVDLRTQELSRIHNHEADCRILSEAESLGFRALLTLDSKFRKRLAPYTAVQLAGPIEYWEGLAIPRGVRPDKSPAQGNPLSEQGWWRW